MQTKTVVFNSLTNPTTGAETSANQQDFSITTKGSEASYLKLLSICSKYFELMCIVGSDPKYREQFEKNPIPYFTFNDTTNAQNDLERFGGCGMIIPENAQLILHPEILHPVIYLKKKDSTTPYFYSFNKCQDGDAQSKYPSAEDEDNEVVIEEKMLEIGVRWFEEQSNGANTFRRPERSEYVKVKPKDDFNKVHHNAVVTIKSAKEEGGEYQYKDVKDYRVVITMPYFLPALDILGEVQFTGRKESAIILSTCK